MDSSSSRLDNEGEFDDDLTHQDDRQNDMGEKFEKSKDLMTFISDEELNDEEENVVLPVVLKDDEKVEEPKESMTFSSLDEVCSYYRKYAKSAGFGIAQRSSRKKKGRKGYVMLICTRGGAERPKTSDCAKPIPVSNKTGCGARICANLCDDGTWFLSKVELMHNHSLSPSKVRFFRSNKKISDAAKRRLELNDRARIRLCKNFNSLVVESGGFENLSFGERDCRNYINKARELNLGKGGAQALCDYFRRMQKQNSGFYYVIDVDDDCRLRNVFWADARSRAAYDFFGDVITFDTTYLTNKYDMPFAPFVGVNHHGQSILLGAGLISREDTDTFVWLFKCWLECMNGQAPKAIMTDQDRAMKNAIAIAFPESRHRYYFLEKYNLHDNAWLNELYMDQTFWVPAYMKDTFWAGMSTTQRSESMNAFFDGYVHSRTTLKEFVDEYDNALRRMVESEARADFDSFNRTILCISALQLEKQFQVVYTNAKFKEVHEQFVKMMSCNNALLKSEGAISTIEVVEYVAVGDHLIEKTFLVYFNENELEVKCTCALFEVKGILCRHSLSVLRTKKVTTLPQRYVLDRWMKDIKREYSKVTSSYDAISDNPHAQIHDKVRNNLEELLSLTSVNTEKRCMELMEKIDQLKELWRCENQSFGIPATVASSSCKKVFSPVKIDCKGRPRTKRKVSVIETVVKKSKVSSKPPRNNNDKTKKRKNQASKSTENQDNTSQSPLPSMPSAAHDHSTQDSVASSSTVAHTFSSHHHSILSQVNLSMDPINLLSTLISQHKYQEAFSTALQMRDVSIVNWLCSQVDIRWVLTMDPLPLSQEVLLQLFWLLPYCFNTNPAEIIAWVTDVFNSIIPTDPAIEMHVRPIFNQVYAALNHISVLPTITDAMRSTIRLLMNDTNYTQLIELYNRYMDKGFEILAFPCTRYKANYPIFQKLIS
ncbi:protein FAR1-RELATED SEQUENCE 5-like [Alnus glutinosa]|uniref:protein FAR1-RELATED SEQUENCE 5-like n=1 Tax=Alnus glutinosa TaxID=3517 RepID=UPI002D798D58|nr:protein FAR1-RELATED SEQUENCE 5-like [Alnus glutinosa]